MKVKCPHCGAVAKAPGEVTGRRVRCPKCKKVLVAMADMEGARSSAEITRHRPKQVESQKSPKPIGNVFTRAWTRSPVAFRMAFLGTFGVIAALWVAWYVFGVTRYFTTPKLPERQESSRQVQVLAPPRSTTQDSSARQQEVPAKQQAKKPVSGQDGPTVAGQHDIRFLAAVVRLDRALHTLGTLQDIRIVAGKRFGAGGKPEDFVATLACCQAKLEDLYMKTRGHGFPVNFEYLREVHEVLLRAVDAEYEFQIAIAAYATNPRSLKNYAEMKEGADNAVSLVNEATFKCVLLWDRAHPKLLEAMVELDRSKKK